jgi:hypothetical protein
MPPGIGKVAPREIAATDALKRALEVEPRANTLISARLKHRTIHWRLYERVLPAEDMPDYDRDPPHWWFEPMSSHDSDKVFTGSIPELYEVHL